MGDEKKDSVQLTFEEEQELFREIWRIWKEYRVPDKSNYYWESVIRELSKLNNGPFAADMIQAILNELERRENVGKSKS